MDAEAWLVVIGALIGAGICAGTLLTWRSRRKAAKRTDWRRIK